MWPTNALTERLNLKWPIFQAPMGSISTPALAAAVSNAGGLGGLGMWGCSAEQAARRIAGFRQQSGGSLNVNYPLWPEPAYTAEMSEAMRRHLQTHYEAKGLGSVPEPQGQVSDVSPEHVAMLMEVKPEAVSFHFGLPDEKVVQAIKSAGIFIVSSATTVAEARMLEQRGVDAVIAQGTEAGGHRATFSGVDISMQVGLFSLLPQVVDAVSVPVIAAGGVSFGSSRQWAGAKLLKLMLRDEAGLRKRKAKPIHLGTDATNPPELVRQLGERRFGHRPRVGDPFCGGGSIPFEAARLGLRRICRGPEPDRMSVDLGHAQRGRWG
jgi:nitronate monooxygenase